MSENLSKNKYDVFISHSSKNKNVADAICANFEQRRIKCWYAPRDIVAGESWPSAIKHGIEDSEILILVFSENANASRQVINEVSIAYNKGKTIIPFRISDTEMNDDFDYFLNRVHWMDAVTQPLEESIDEMRKYVEHILGYNSIGTEEPEMEQPVKVNANVLSEEEIARRVEEARKQAEEEAEKRIAEEQKRIAEEIERRAKEERRRIEEEVAKRLEEERKRLEKEAEEKLEADRILLAKAKEIEDQQLEQKKEEERKKRLKKALLKEEQNKKLLEEKRLKEEEQKVRATEKKTVKMGTVKTEPEKPLMSEEDEKEEALRFFSNLKEEERKKQLQKALLEEEAKKQKLMEMRAEEEKRKAQEATEEEKEGAIQFFANLQKGKKT